uniref:Septin 7 n=1 Tax=Tetraselmis sp. GSL018 TaxID=582737 RepID=A0A061SDN1_9CHLO|mmetsp:Transcript_15463/g.36776  ORF Transcript_15463/g.36776 Transcript_15463/m.36776 type:complete len:398 (-) Transcript_15463:225-1418(-)
MALRNSQNFSQNGTDGAKVPETDQWTEKQHKELLGPQRPRPTKLWTKRYVKIMVVGDSGLGKTTLIRTLLSGPGEKLDLHDGSETSHREFLKNPEALCSTLTWDDDVDRVTWVYRVQDTPGYGDDLNIMTNIQKMKAFVDSCNKKWLEIEQDMKRGVDMTLVEDPRIDLCIFCLPPHRLRNIDIRYMHELGQVVPIVPVVTKADTMTIREAAMHRADVMSRLSNPSLRGLKGPVNVFHFEDETLERSGVKMVNGMYHMPPFLVVASNEVNREKAQQDPPIFWPQRQYKWGMSEAFNPEHSDLLNLRSLLFQEACEEIAATKRFRFEKWRVNYLKRKAAAANFRQFVFKVTSVAAVGIGAIFLSSPYGKGAREFIGNGFKAKESKADKVEPAKKKGLF